jgi:hypothetical protein
MYSKLRRHLNGTTVLAVIAIMLATTGGAYAAGRYVITSVTQIKPNVRAALRGNAGPAGKNGAAGAVGAPGAVGATGPQGPQGNAGSNGSNGSNGSSGKSVVASTFEGSKEPAGEPCKKAGGSSFEVEGSGKKSFACNGGAGSFPETLASGHSEKGAWSINTSAEEVTEGITATSAVSFPVPLEAGLGKEHVFFVRAAGEDEAECPGSAASPAAAAGDFCAFVGELHAEPIGIQVPSATLSLSGTGISGAVLKFESTGPGLSYGTWAVTAP